MDITILNENFYFLNGKPAKKYKVGDICTVGDKVGDHLIKGRVARQTTEEDRTKMQKATYENKALGVSHEKKDDSQGTDVDGSDDEAQVKSLRDELSALGVNARSTKDVGKLTEMVAEAKEQQND